MLELTLSEDDIVSVETTTSVLQATGMCSSQPQLLQEAAVLAQQLPQPLRRRLLGFKLTEETGVMLVRGLPIDQAAVGPTPTHWRNIPRDASLTREEAFLILLSSVLGDVFAWATQQDGRLMHNVLPIMEDENEQLGSGSRQLLWWHTEDAFHDHRADYLGLLCLRNPDSVETTYADIGDLQLSSEQRRLLFEPQYTVLPDNSHSPQHNLGLATDHGQDGVSPAFEVLATKGSVAAPRGVLFGDTADPYLRLDPYFMPEPTSERHAQALRCFREIVDDAICGVVLQPGDLLFIDNYRAVHGRVPFTARFDGTDRWLKRVNVTRDLRRSRELRRSAQERTIHG